MSDNLKIWEKVRTVPATAQKPITGGRLSGKTDINPMWRLKTLTEQFGPCGTGWKYEIVDKRLERGANDEIAAFVDINLYVREGDGWSDPIPGTGGSMFVEKEKSGLHVNDECFKMALTDAISVSCKALGFGADVYWDKDKSKYDKPQDKPQTQQRKPQTQQQGQKRTDLPADALVCHVCEVPITAAIKAVSEKKYGRPLCPKHQREADKSA